MTPRRQYWPLELNAAQAGFSLELRSDMAWQLIRHFGAVAGEPDGQDSAGRSVLGLQLPEGLVARCFAIADAFVDQAEARGELRQLEMSDEEWMERAGYLGKIKSRAEYPVAETPGGGAPFAVSPEETELRHRHAQERRELREQLRAAAEAKEAAETAEPKAD